MDDEQKLRLFICDLVDIDESDLQKDDALFSSGIIDSFNLLDLVSFVENLDEILLTCPRVSDIAKQQQRLQEGLADAGRTDVPGYAAAEHQGFGGLIHQAAFPTHRPLDRVAENVWAVGEREALDRLP